MMEFEWDENKSASNKQKHGIDFYEAKSVFDDSGRITSIDLRKDYGERRYITIGKMLNIIVVVIYTFRYEKIRIISARMAGSYERESYSNMKIK